MNHQTWEDAFGIADKLIHAIAMPFAIEGNTYRISVSIGISFYREHGADLDQLIVCADHAMYVAKQRGKNTWVVYEGSQAAHSLNTRTALAEADGDGGREET